MIPILTDEEIRAKLAPLKGEKCLKFHGIGICWRAIGDVLGIRQQHFYSYASGKYRINPKLGDKFREQISEFLYRYERGEITLTRENGKWEIIFNKDAKPRNRLQSMVDITPDGVKLRWVKQSDY